MKSYNVNRTFFCPHLKIYIPESATIYRSDKTTLLVLKNCPNSENSNNEIISDFEFTNSNDVAWFDGMVANTVNGDLITLTGTTSEAESGGSSGGSGSGIAYDSNYYKSPEISDNATTNGVNLLAAYEAAKLLTPNEQALSSTNRACVLLFPALYDLGEESLNLDTNYVDIIGVGDKSGVKITTINNNATILQSADNVHLENFTAFNNFESDYGDLNFNSDDPCVYGPQSEKCGTVIRNVNFQEGNFEGCYTFSTRLSIEYCGNFYNVSTGQYSFGGGGGYASGYFEGCTGGNNSFGGDGGTANGIFLNCSADSYSFGGNANGIFIRCKGYDYCFGNNDSAYGNFTDCTCNDYGFGTGGTAGGRFTRCSSSSHSFGSYGEASGTFTDCKGESYCFGGDGQATGYFYNCQGENVCFGSGFCGYSTGNFYNCKGEEECFGGVSCNANGVYVNCSAGSDSFSSESTANGYFENCTGGDNCFGGSGGIASGEFKSCTGGAYCFGGNGGTLSGSFTNCNAAYSSFGDDGYINNCYCLLNCTIDNSIILDGVNTVKPIVGGDIYRNAYNLYLATARLTSMPPQDGAKGVILLSPAIYDFDGDYIFIGMENLSIIGLGTPADTIIKSYMTETSKGVINQQYDYFTMKNVTILNYGEYSQNYNDTDPAAYYPISSVSNTKFENVIFSATDGCLPMRRDYEYDGEFINCEAIGSYGFGGGGDGVASGIFKNCKSGYYGFGGDGGVANGIFTNCEGNTHSFAGSGVASGTFINCTSHAYSFGGDGGTASGEFTECYATYGSYGSFGGNASGTFKKCKGRFATFGCGGEASGLFIDCEGYDSTFGAEGIASGYFFNCQGGESSFGGGGCESNGYFLNCYASDDGAFGGYGVLSSGTYINCVCNGSYAFGGGGGTASGIYKNCKAFNDSFGGNNGVASGNFTDCQGGQYCFGGNGVASGWFLNCHGSYYSFGGRMNGTMKDCKMDGYFFGNVQGRIENMEINYISNYIPVATGAKLYNCTLYTAGPGLFEPAYYSNMDSVINRLDTPPVSPSDGHRYLVGGAGTDEWAGHDNEIATWNSGSGIWIFNGTAKHDTTYDITNSVYWVYNGVAWSQEVTVYYSHCRSSYPNGDVLVISGLDTPYNVVDLNL